jgi:hypothetical protein
MKRSLESIVYTLPTDVTIHMESDIIYYVCMLSPTILLNWHSTCYTYYRKWCDKKYLLTLLSRTFNANEKAYKVNPHAEFFANMIRLDRMFLTIRLSECILEALTPSFSKAQSAPYDLITDYMGVLTLRSAFIQIDENRFAIYSNITDKMVKVVRSVCSFTKLRTGWRIFLRRGKSQTVVDPKTDSTLKPDDFICLQIDPGCYK